MANMPGTEVLNIELKQIDFLITFDLIYWGSVKFLDTARLLPLCFLFQYGFSSFSSMLFYISASYQLELQNKTSLIYLLENLQNTYKHLGGPQGGHQRVKVVL